MPYILNEEKLLPGDIILLRNNTNTSLTIRELCNSKFSHAILYLGNSSFMEADTKGVTFFSTNRYCFRNRQNIGLYRIRPDYKVDLDKIVGAARKYSYRDYDLTGVRSMYKARYLGLKTSPITQTQELQAWDKPIFCSQLIGLSYHDAGITLSQSKDIADFTLADIENSPLLDIIDDFLIEINEEQSQLYTLRSEEQLPENVLTKQTNISQKILANLKTRYKEHNIANAADLQDAIDKLQTLSAEQVIIADEIICELLNESGFLDLWQEHERLHPELHSPFLLLRQFNLDDNHRNILVALDIIDDLMKGLDQTIIFQSKNRDISLANFEKSSLTTFQLLYTMYDNFINSLKNAMFACKEVHSALNETLEIYRKAGLQIQ